MKLVAYKQGSRSAKSLCKALGIKQYKHEGKKLKLKGTIINWGSSEILPNRGLLLEINAFNIINKPGFVKNATSKLQAFQIMSGRVSIPEWTESREEAVKWLAEGFKVVCRHVLNGHSGNGIEILSEVDDLVPECPLYTRYTLKNAEYRIHVHNGECFFIQRKARNKDVTDDKVNWQVRNHANGFVFANQDVQVSQDVKDQAIAAITALGLDFGAVDIVETKKGKAFVLEVNTAPGLEGSTLDAYVEQFKQYL